MSARTANDRPYVTVIDLSEKPVFRTDECSELCSRVTANSEIATWLLPEHFDLLIDYEHRLVCLDETKQMQEAVRERVLHLPRCLMRISICPLPCPWFLSIRLSGISDQPLLLQLDSGIDVPLLFECGRQLPHVQTIVTAQRHRGRDEVAQAFAVLTPQDMRMGSHTFHQISFMTPIAVGKDIPIKPDVDGVLPTVLFRNAFISYSDHLAVLQP